MATVLDIDTQIIDTIQDMINSFVLDIKPGGRHWISKDFLDKHFSPTPNTRKNILTYGPEHFNEIITHKKILESAPFLQPTRQ